MNALDGLVFLVGQLGLLLLAAALLGAVVGRYLWAAPRIRRLDAEVYRLRRNGSGPPEGDPQPPI
ncbi:hypothetical protein [Kineosporia sp. A_224]|uniref:hypothetical protein n=1 Tax=Kineosporia sp. A_224 TaxID=1962180 RepID=UPI000B4B4BD1|nr:hypothetical protein [Kineosporia sp. A_224]